MLRDYSVLCELISMMDLINVKGDIKIEKKNEKKKLLPKLENASHMLV